MNKKIIAAAKHFARTGVILDSLLPLFNQHGYWFEDADTEGIKEAIILQIIDYGKLAASRIATRNENRGSTLPTSYESYRMSPMKITLREIKGSLCIQNSPVVRAPNLRKVVGGIYLHLNTKFVAPSLIVVGDNIIADSPAIHLPRLRTAGAICARNAHRFSAPCLSAVISDLVVPSAIEFDTPDLVFVGGNLNSESAPNFCPVDLVVMGKWTMHPAARKRLAMKTLRLSPP